MKSLLLGMLLIIAIGVHAQVSELHIEYNLVGGDTTIVIDNATGALYASWQMTALGLDADDASFNLQKSNNLTIYGDVPAASGTFTAGDSITFIEFANTFNNTSCRMQIFANSVTEGILKIDVNTFR